MSDAATPVGAEQEMRAIRSEMTKAYQGVRAARTDEVEAKRLLKRARADALLGGDCPPTGRGGMTVAERDAWVDRRVDDESYALDVAEVNRKNAEDYLRTVRDQASLTQSIARLVEQAYSMSGRA